MAVILRSHDVLVAVDLSMMKETANGETRSLIRMYLKKSKSPRESGLEERKDKICSYSSMRYNSDGNQYKNTLCSKWP